MRGLKPELNTKIRDRAGKKFPSSCLAMEENRGILVLTADPSCSFDVMTFLRDDEECRFNVLMDLTAVDYLGKRPSGERFEVVYLLMSTATMHRVRVKVKAGEGAKVPSVVTLWKGANWPEREVFDLFGIEFSGHPLMERIIMPEEFRGHPLRKDFPLEGQGEDYLIESILLKGEMKSR